MELAAEIIFSDKSAVIRNGRGWRANFGRTRSFSGETEAVRFILELDGAAVYARTQWHA